MQNWKKKNKMRLVERLIGTAKKNYGYFEKSKWEFHL